MSVLHTAFSAFAKLREPLITHWIEEPEAAQLGVWTDLMRRGEHTFFGVQHGFSSIASIDDFRARVPVQDYEILKPYVDRISAGEERVLWDEPVHWFAKSSGTTSDKSKFIPISEDSLRDNHFLASKDLLCMYVRAHPDTQVLDGKTLILGGSHQISPLNAQIQYGDLSAVLMQNEPWLGRWLRVPDLSIALMDEWEEKIEKLARATMHEPITAIAGVPTWSIVLLKKILQLTGARTIAQVWSQLELYIHGGVNFAPYTQHFEQLMGKSVRYRDVYNASEGFFAFQDTDDSENGLLLLLEHGIFYEFMPKSEWSKSAPKTVLLSEVRVGETYALVISTCGGLWRYMVGDTITFTSTAPYRIRVVGRTKQYINAFGEELIVDNTDAAMREACARAGAIMVDYTAAPIYFDKSSNAAGTAAHEWLVEFERPPADMEKFTHDLDAILKTLNSDYEAKRYKDLALRMPVVRALKKGTFNRWLKSKGKLGGQHKVPRLCNDRSYVAEIMADIYA